MSKPHSGFIAVDAGLAGQTIVEAIFARVQEIHLPDPPENVGDALDDLDLAFVSAKEGAVEMQMRRKGYLAREVELELFEPARKPARWLEPLLQENFAETPDWTVALRATCEELARSEPVAKPHPDDPAAKTWKVAGPGGHVRHFVARRTIEELLQGRDTAFDGDPADLKTPWMYGFFLRACQEVLPHDPPATPN
jgi:hypothetical protein